MLYVAPVVRGAFCSFYMLPELCVGVSVGGMCCLSCALGFRFRS